MFAVLGYLLFGLVVGFALGYIYVNYETDITETSIRAETDDLVDYWHDMTDQLHDAAGAAGYVFSWEWEEDAEGNIVEIDGEPTGRWVMKKIEELVTTDTK